MDRVPQRPREGEEKALNQLEIFAADAILSVDTLWGGDVMSPSGARRFIADSWFSGEPLPAAYTRAAAERLRRSGGVSAPAPDKDAVEAYLREVNIPYAIDGMRAEAFRCGEPRRSYFTGLALCLVD